VLTDKCCRTTRLMLMVFFSVPCCWQFIQLLRKSGNIEKLRAAREEMNKYFPLTPKMWQEWAKDEISLSSGFVTLFSQSDLMKYLCYRH
jgi:hypothetical protein